MTSLVALLTARGLDAQGMVAIRNTLHPEDTSAEFLDINDVISANAIGMYDRMQDGVLIAHETRVLSFAALDNGQAKLTGFRKFLLRRPGIVPGDIVYDYDAAHLLHSFIARAATPMFYDAPDEEGLDDLIGHLVLQWPQPLTHNILRADDAGLMVA
jgi:hypothetical protein